MSRAQSSFLTLPSGLRMHYRLAGSLQSPVLVLLNGLLSDLSMWQGVVPLLTRNFRVLSFDGRGQGLTDAPKEGPYQTAQMAQDVWELLSLLELPYPWLVGLSNGGALSLELLTNHPEAFSGAVVCSVTPRIDLSMELKTSHWAKCLELGGPTMLFDAVAPYIWGDAFLEARYSVLKAYQNVVTGVDPTGQLHQIRGVLGWDIRSRLGAIVRPVMVLAGEKDLLTPPWKCRETARLIPGAQFRIVPGIGHSYPVEDPEAFADQVRGFILP